MEKLKPLMFVGTASDVGKSLINTGFCRILKQDGYAPAPFKAQNMSLNSYATPEGLEIGRAQAIQAEACGLECHVDMNPVLLKPTSDKSSQVILLGKPVGNQSAYEYFMGNNKEALFSEAKAAYGRLAAKHNPVVLEGAGSISELNLKHRDITNMRMAQHVGADVYLIADIDRGGVFGSVYGTLELLSKEERALVKGIIINKFRGDAALFESGKKTMEDLCKIPVVGVLPFSKDFFIEEEDSVGLHKKAHQPASGKINIAVVLLNRMSNFTDFNRLEMDIRVHLFYSQDPAAIEGADIIIVPGSKNTIADLTDIKNSGVAQGIIRAHRNKKTIIGICGGYQMLGLSVSDPLHVEGNIEQMSGLSLLPVHTVLAENKITRQTQFRFKNSDAECKGYEIHMGQTKPVHEESPVTTTLDGAADGYWLDATCWGTYMHGILDNASVIDALLSPFSNKETSSFNYSDFKNQQYDKLALHIRENIDLEYIYESLKKP